MYPLFESIQIKNGEILNPSYHQERFRNSYLQYFNSEPLYKLLENVIIPKNYRKGIVKLRIKYDATVKFSEFGHYTKKNIRTLRLVDGKNVNYVHKFSDRKALDQLWSLRNDCDDVLIIKDGFITDTWYANIVFFDGSQWITPNTYLLNGTCRSRLIQKGMIKEIEVRPSNLKDFTGFKIINAMMDFEDQKLLDIANIIM